MTEADQCCLQVPKFKPNLVLLDAGTNNCNAGGTVPDAGKNVTAMIENIYALSPGVTVILATILVNSQADQDACRVGINAQVRFLTFDLHPLIRDIAVKGNTADI